MNYDESVKYLYSLGHETLALKFGLETTRLLFCALDDPHKAFFKVQIAGTNGKGSTAAFVSSIAHQAGITTGLYTSPHLTRINERIRINDEEIANEDFARIATNVRRASEDLRDADVIEAVPTFFEQTTAIALSAFKEANVSLAILETGLGGRLDSTTAADAQIACIAPVGLDHQEYLGDTLAEIAAEKAAIIRRRITHAAVIANQRPQAREVIFKRCEECNITPLYDDCAVQLIEADASGRVFAMFKTGQDIYERVKLSLRGRHQTINAALAVRVAETLRENSYNISRANIIAGLEHAKHRGRLELLRADDYINFKDYNKDITLLFDGAHNEASAQVLRDYLDEFTDVPLTLLFGAMRDKDLQSIAAKLFPLAHHLILTHINNPRAASLDSLTNIAAHFLDAAKITRADSAAKALRAAFDVTPLGGIICITGSLYLIGEIQSLMIPADNLKSNSELK